MWSGLGPEGSIEGCRSRAVDSILGRDLVCAQLSAHRAAPRAEGIRWSARRGFLRAGYSRSSVQQLDILEAQFNNVMIPVSSEGTVVTDASKFSRRIPHRRHPVRPYDHPRRPPGRPSRSKAAGQRAACNFNLHRKATRPIINSQASGSRRPRARGMCSSSWDARRATGGSDGGPASERS